MPSVYEGAGMNEDERYEGMLGHRLLPDGRELMVMPLTFGRARVVIYASQKSWVYDDGY